MIDGENVSCEFADPLITAAKEYGELIIKRVYGNARLINGWSEAPGCRIVHSGSGKNSADILLAIEAVDLSHANRVDTFVLASSDGDFSHLAHRLREAGFQVIGLGEDKAPEKFKNSCTRFTTLAREQAKPVAGLSKLDRQIHEVIGKTEARTHVRMNRLNNLMRSAYDVKISSYPEKTWRKYLLSKPELYRCDKGGPDARVYLITES